MGLGDWGDFLNRLMKKLPIQDRKERILNKIHDLEREKNDLLTETHSNTTANRMARIINDLVRLRNQVQSFK